LRQPWLQKGEKKYAAEESLTEDADEVLVDGDSSVGKAKVVQPALKTRMFAGEELRPE
jgi:hypothetical protein